MNNLASRDGELFLIDHVVKPEEAAEYCQKLLHGLDWREEEIIIYGKPVKVPRLVCWYGEPEAVYRYSGVTHIPQPWTPILDDLKARVERLSGHHFNSLLANLYRNGNDAMGWHADNEKELGQDPFIASLSFGDKRLFKLRHKKSRETIDLLLGEGNLLLMGGCLQRHWQHCLPRTSQSKDTRINLTFRLIQHP
jgi:alkylated DNA repair dioxygenase AlkB